MALILCNTWKVDFLDICFLYRDAPPLLPSDTTQGYRTVKAKLGCKKVRPWKWMPFTNPARRDGAIFHHWRRVAEEGKDYPFARFNKVDILYIFNDTHVMRRVGIFVIVRVAQHLFLHQIFWWLFAASYF